MNDTPPKFSEDVRENVAEPAMSTEEALKRGLDKKSTQLGENGAEVYQSMHPLLPNAQSAAGPS